MGIGSSCYGKGNNGQEWKLVILVLTVWVVELILLLVSDVI